MAKASTKKQKKRLRQAADFPPLKQLSQEQVSDICATLRISRRYVAELKDHLDELVDQVNGWMSREKTANRQRDGKRIETMRKRIAAAQYYLKGLEIDGRLAIRSAAARLADIVSGDWLRYRFPGDAPPVRSGIDRRHARSHYRDSTDEPHSNYQFIRYRAPETLSALLRDLDAVLASALTSLASDPRARGGQQPLTYRHNVLVNLCEIWERIGNNVAGTPKSDFVEFCHYIVEAMGWHTGGLDAAIPPAVTNWRNLRNLP
jgi:hypothetical protein